MVENHKKKTEERNNTKINDIKRTYKEYIFAHCIKITSMFLFILAGSMGKNYFVAISTSQQAFIVYLTGVPILFFSYISFPKQKIINTKYPYRKTLFISRILIAVIAKYCWLNSLQLLQLNDAVATLYLTPIFAIIFSILFLNEKIVAYWCIPTVISILGVFIIAKNSTNMHVGNVYNNIIGFGYAITASALYGAYNIICKKQAEHEHYILQVIYVFIGSAIILCPFAVIKWTTIPEKMYIILLCIGIATSFSVMFNFIAYKFASVAELGIHDYLRVVISITYVYIVDGVMPNYIAMIGFVLIIISNIMLLRKPKDLIIVNGER